MPCAASDHATRTIASPLANSSVAAGSSAD